MRNGLLLLCLLAALGLSGCGSADEREQLRDACDSLIDVTRDNPNADASDVLADIHGDVEKLADADGDTGAIAQQLLDALDAGGSAAQVGVHAAGICAQAYAESAQ
ncbi:MULTISPECIES: hypothetical protein [unclassified Nocardioides]|uniref:hypothetical protein n=1 Tax=unclassified Nocardioides TaxID=2615069 RepID=UPI00361FCD6B